MRIHLSIPPSSIAALAKTGPTDPPLVQIGKDLIMIELQGSLGFEGDARGKVIGVLGFERMDKPTLHLGQHHLLHGKIVSLPKPLAILRRKPTPSSEEFQPESSSNGHKRRVLEKKPADGKAVLEASHGASDGEQEDDLDEENLDLGETQDLPKRLLEDLPSSSPPAPSSATTINLQVPQPTPTRPHPSSSALPPHLRTHLTPIRPLQLGGGDATNLHPGAGDTGAASPDGPMTSSPVPMPYQARDYSSDLSSPIRGPDIESDDESSSEDERQSGVPNAQKMAHKKRKRREGESDLGRRSRSESKVERTKEYEVVGVVRKKVVFALRPEPIVTATVLPD